MSTMTITSLTPERRAVNSAWRKFLRLGDTRELRDLKTNTDAAGAAFIEQGYSALTEAAKFYGPIATLVKRRDVTDGAPQKFAVSDDTASSMSYLAETGSALTLEADPTVSSTVARTDTLTTLVKATWQELSDAAFDLESFLVNTLGLRVSRAVEYALTLGKDNGTHTTLPSSPAGGALAGVSAAVTGATIATTLTYANLAALAGSVDHAYYINGAYMASPSVFAYLLQQVDSTGRPLYPVVDGVMQINGKPLVVNAAMAAANAASSPVVTFGDWSKQYAYINGGGVRIRPLVERFADTQETGLLVYHRLGAAQLLSNAVKALATPAS